MTKTDGGEPRKATGVSQRASRGITVVSGGQTGADRGALDAAIESGTPAGGWCPKGRIAEDGRIPEKYPLWELPGGNYRERTQKNVVDSDGTVIVYFGTLSGGTELTLRICILEKKPYVLIDAEVFAIKEAAKKIRNFADHYSIHILNVAGPRASKVPDAYGYTKKLLLCFLESGG